ncbi:rubrerythrin-like domain-containing protein [Halocatena marina]|uniref:Rubrerythrin-like domain-containing protein n=1 Tax=Halocatena marina TaxID=2934937 RepID=A0ABD5YTC5_9EURY|nr:rubrerythrin-like domain-containing protein [Halocatena marina]
MPHDPASKSKPYYECVDCGKRVMTDEDGRLCSRCGGYLQNIGVPRQQ